MLSSSAVATMETQFTQSPQQPELGRPLASLQGSCCMNKQLSLCEVSEAEVFLLQLNTAYPA